MQVWPYGHCWNYMAANRKNPLDINAHYDALDNPFDANEMELGNTCRGMLTLHEKVTTKQRKVDYFAAMEVFIPEFNIDMDTIEMENVYVLRAREWKRQEWEWYPAKF